MHQQPGKEADPDPAPTAVATVLFLHSRPWVAPVSTGNKESGSGNTPGTHNTASKTVP